MGVPSNMPEEGTVGEERSKVIASIGPQEGHLVFVHLEEFEDLWRRRWVGGWVGACVGWVEENEAVGMSYCEWRLDGWVGGWVSTFLMASRLAVCLSFRTGGGGG